MADSHDPARSGDDGPHVDGSPAGAVTPERARRLLDPREVDQRLVARAVGLIKRWVGEVIHDLYDLSVRWAAIGPDTRRGRRFGSFGRSSVICFPPTALMNERYIHIGEGTLIGPNVSLSAGMAPGQQCLTERVVSIGDRCLIGRGSGIVGHLSIEIGDDVWTGHHVYITDQNHGYDDPTRPISEQFQRERAVRIGSGSWLGHGTVVLPGADIGERSVIGANSVVTGRIPDRCVAVGAPARVIRYLDGGSADEG